MDAVDVTHWVATHVAPDRRFETLCACGVGLNLSEQDIDAIGRHAGARLNACTCVDRTSYFFDVGKGNVVPFVAILADSLARLHVTDDHVASEVKAVLQELKRGTDQPVRTAVSHASQLLFAPGEPGHLDTIGEESVLMRQQAATLLRFYRTHYHPWRATITVVGSFDVARVKHAIATCFGPIGVDAYAAHRAVDALVPGDPVPDHVRSRVKHVQGPYGTVLQDRITRYARAHTCHCTVDPLDAVRPVAPPPMRTHRTVFASSVPSDHPVVVHGFRIPGWSTDATATWRAVAAVWTPSSGPPGRVPTTWSAFVDQRQRGGALYVACDTNATDDDPWTNPAVFAPLTDAEYARVSATVQAEWVTAQERVGTFAETVVDRLGHGTDPAHVARPPYVDRSAVDRALASLDPVQRVTVTVAAPPSASAVETAVVARHAVQDANAVTVQRVQVRCDPVLAPPKALALAPPVHALDVDDIPWMVPYRPGPAATVHGDQGYVHPVSGLAHYARTPSEGPQRTVASYGTAVAGSTWASMVVDDRVTARAGIVDVAWSGNGITVTVPYTDRTSLIHDIAAVEHRTSVPLDAAVFETRRQAVETALVRQAHTPLALALHAAAHAVGPVPYTLDAALTYVRTLTPDVAVQAFHDRMNQTVTTLVQPARTGPTAAPAPAEPAEPSIPTAAPVPAPTTTEPAAAPIPTAVPVTRPGATAAAQAAIVLARRSTVPVDHPDRALLPILYHIACHSLGSRLYHIRATTGLFYGASGAFGADGDVDHPFAMICQGDAEVMRSWEDLGMMTFGLALRHPGLVEAAFPVAGWLPEFFVDEALQPKRTYPPIRAMHGREDPIVPAEPAMAIVRKLQDRGLDATIEVFPWDQHSMSEQMWRRHDAQMRVYLDPPPPPSTPPGLG